MKSFFSSVQGSIIIGAVIISLAILISNGSIKFKSLNSQKTAKTLGAQTSAQPSAAPVPPDDSGPVKVSLDDDPVLGDKEAKLTLVEFSDYECPFCKRYFDSTFPQIKKEYIDTGKVKIIYRDLPLSFHQNAHKEAEAAECSREQGGDEAYFKFHDIMFTKTTSNGTGLSLDQLPDLANQVGLDGSKLKACLDSGKYVEEVDKDLAYAQTVGADGTPTFFIGKSDSSGTINGTKIVGAQPFSAFKTVIDNLLK
ncbi:DsbA family protein [Candidatus Daviesbacteria bacterium]|nr:DsbA family protein [Candidatus Daviesbacteria bacterium]